MGFQIEQKENNMAAITVTIPQVELQKAITTAYNREKGKYQMQDFRKGHALQAIIEKFYGQGVFFESAVNSCVNDTYPGAAKESGLTIVSRPEISVTKIGTDKDLVYTATVATKPEVKLGQYKGVEMQKADVTVTGESLNKALQRELEKNVRLMAVDDRVAEMGGNVKIDSGGSIDGVYLDGGKGEDYPLVLDSGSLIDGSGEQVMGHRTGNSFDISVTFPTEYYAKELTSKEAVFACELLKIQRRDLPELNDEFASEVSQFETLDEYRADLKKQLEEAKARSVAAQNENNVAERIVENAELAPPASMVEMRCGQMFDDYACRIQSQGLLLEQYLQHTGMTVEKLKEQFRLQAERNLKTRLTLREAVKAENIAVSEEAINAEIAEIAETYKTVSEKMEEYVSAKQREGLTMDLKVQEAVDFFTVEARPQ